MNHELFAAVVTIMSTWAAWSIRGLWEARQEIAREKMHRNIYTQLCLEFKADLTDALEPLKADVRQLEGEHRDFSRAIASLDKAIMAISLKMHLPHPLPKIIDSK